MFRGEMLFFLRGYSYISYFWIATTNIHTSSLWYTPSPDPPFVGWKKAKWPILPKRCCKAGRISSSIILWTPASKWSQMGLMAAFNLRICYAVSTLNSHHGGVECWLMICVLMMIFGFNVYNTWFNSRRFRVCWPFIYFHIRVGNGVMECSIFKPYSNWLVVSTHLKNMCQNWIISPSRGENKNCLKPPS